MKSDLNLKTCLMILLCICGISTAEPVWGQSDITVDNRINIAAIFSLTGHGATANRSSVLGTRLAVEEINNSGGLLNRTLNLILLDNMSTPIGSSLAARQAVESGAVSIIGAQWSSHSLAIAEVAQASQVPMISNFSTHPQLTRIGEYIFRVCYDDNFQGRIMAEFAIMDLGARSASLLVDLNSDYSLKLSSIFRTHFEQLGGRIIDEIEYKAKEVDLGAIVAKAKRKTPSVMFLTGHDESGRIAHRLQSEGIDSIFLGGDGWGDQEFFLSGGKYIKQGYFCTHWSTDSDREKTRNFVRKYQHRENFGTGAALSYDAVMVMAKAVKKAGSTNGSDVISALLEMDSHDGVTGMIKFNETGNPVKSAVIMKVEKGVPTYLKTMVPR